MLDLKRIHSNPVTLIRLPYNVKNYITIPEQFKGKIYSLVDYEKKSETLKKMEKKNLFFINFSELRDILLNNIKEKKEKVDFCSIIIINDIHSSTLEKLILINLWVEIYKHSKIRPYLLITCVSEFIPSLPFHLEKENCQNLFPEDDKRIFSYHNSNNHPNSIKLAEETCDKVVELHRSMKKNSEDSIWLVFYPEKTDISKILYQKIGDEAVVISEKSFRKLKNIFKTDRRTIIIVTSPFFNNVLTDKIDGVIDSVSTMTGENVNYASKEICDIRASQAKSGFVYRMCTEEYYKDLPTVSLRHYSYTELDKNYITILKHGINIKNFFSNILGGSKTNEDIERLENLGVLSGDTITEIGDLVETLPFKTENCNLLYEWYTSKKPIFPALVACSISEITSPLTKGHDKNDVFRHYLSLFNDLLKKGDDFMSLESEEFEHVIDKIRKSLIPLNKITKVDIGTYNSENLVKELLPFFEKSYYQDTYCLVNKKDGIYSNKDKVYKVKEEDFGYKFDRFPYKIFAFYKVRINDNPSSIQKGKNYICYFAY